MHFGGRRGVRIAFTRTCTRRQNASQQALMHPKPATQAAGFYFGEYQEQQAGMTALHNDFSVAIIPVPIRLCLFNRFNKFFIAIKSRSPVRNDSRRVFRRFL
jgi:hypothetical protein